MKREMKHMERFAVILLLSKMKSGAKRVVFCSFCCFIESEKLRCEKEFCKRAKFFIHLRHFKAVFLFLVERFSYDLVLILGWFL